MCASKMEGEINRIYTDEQINARCRQFLAVLLYRVSFGDLKHLYFLQFGKQNADASCENVMYL